MKAMPNTRDLLASLSSTVCPACGQLKGSRMTLCRQHYYALPNPMRKALYNRVGEGYEEALAAALDYLGADQFHLPVEPQP
jgi:hypothetical protein